MGLFPGDRIGRYEVLALLGSGGMGDVYRARDPSLQRQVALKVVRADRDAGTQGSARLLREARAAAILAHPNVVAIHDVGEVRGPDGVSDVAFIAMELVAGAPLRAYVGDPSVPLSDRVAWLSQVARALAAAHAVGIVHRDVKPENVMVGADGAVKVLDFGIARMTPAGPAEGAQASLATLTGEGVVLGTPRYMSPEQVRGDALDERTDQFSWGVMAYELLSGSHPWQKPEALHAIAEILLSEPPPLASIARDVPAPVVAVVTRALAKDPAARFPTMDAVVAALEGRPYDAAPRAAPPSRTTSPVATTRPASLPTPAARQPPKPGQARAVVAIGLVALAVAGGILGTRGRLTRRGASPPEASATPPPCESNAACVRANGGAAARCLARGCVAMASEDCVVHAEPGDLSRDDTVWIGGMFPAAPDSPFRGEARAMELAREDFSEALGSGGARPIATLVCDETVDPVRAARHLVDVGVPAVVGFRSGTSALAAIPPVLLPARVLSILSIAQASDLTRIPEPEGAPRLVWRTTLNNASEDAPTSALIAQVLTPMLRARGVTGPVRVAAALTGGGVHDLTGDSLGAIRFNGKSALENGPDFRQVVFRDDDTSDAAARSLAEFAPHIVLDFAGDSFAGRVLGPLEASWSRGPRPFYVVGSELEAPLLDFIGTDAGRRRRFFSVTNVSSSRTNAQLVLRYNRAFPGDPVLPTDAPQPSYDAFYTLAYAVHALGAHDEVTGPALARAIEAHLLPPGPAIDVGPGGIFDAFSRLRAGGSIDLNGAIGSLDFDPQTGEAPIDEAILCCGVDAHGRASGAIESGLVFDARTGRLTGGMRCP